MLHSFGKESSVPNNEDSLTVHLCFSPFSACLEPCGGKDERCCSNDRNEYGRLYEDVCNDPSLACDPTSAIPAQISVPSAEERTSHAVTLPLLTAMVGWPVIMILAFAARAVALLK